MLNSQPWNLQNVKLSSHGILKMLNYQAPNHGILKMFNHEIVKNVKP